MATPACTAMTEAATSAPRRPRSIALRGDTPTPGPRRGSAPRPPTGVRPAFPPLSVEEAHRRTLADHRRIAAAPASESPRSVRAVAQRKAAPGCSTTVSILADDLHRRLRLVVEGEEEDRSQSITRGGLVMQGAETGPRNRWLRRRRPQQNSQARVARECPPPCIGWQSTRTPSTHSASEKRSLSLEPTFLSLRLRARPMSRWTMEIGVGPDLS